MQQIITAKLKLITTPEQLQALRAAQLAYRVMHSTLSVPTLLSMAKPAA